MFQLEKEIKKWLKSLKRSAYMEASDITELESHLRDEIDFQIKNGHDEEAAFRLALSKSASPETLKQEYRDADLYGRSRPLWHPSRFMPSLFWNFIKIAVRRIKRQKGYSFINVAGLAIGLAGVILISTYVRFERSYDRFHTRSDRIYRALIRPKVEPGAVQNYLANTSYLLADAITADIPEIVRATRINDSFGRDVVLQSEKATLLETGLFTDSSFLGVFDFSLLRGNPETVLSAAGSIVLTEKTAEKLFGSSDPLGNSIRFKRDENVLELIVAGIIRDIPLNSHLQFGFLISMDTLRQDESRSYMFENWGVINFKTYFELNNPENLAAVESKIPEFMEKNLSEDDRFALILQPLEDIHLYSQIRGALETNNEIRFVHLFSAIALILLLIAVLNYINLATSRSAFRMKEIGVRKVAGANRRQLFAQFVGESMVLTLIAFVVSIVLIQLFWSWFIRLVGVNLEVRTLWNPTLILFIAGLVLIVGFLSGFFPGFLLSNLHPVQALRDIARSKSSILRKMFVFLQFGASVVLIAGTFVIHRQMNFIQVKDPGYNRRQVIVIPIREEETQTAAEVIKQDYLGHPEVLAVSLSSAVPTEISNELGVSTELDNGEKSSFWLRCGYVDENFLDLYEIELLQGRNIGPGEKTAALVNESLVKSLNWKNPLGKILKFFGDRQLTVVGVIKDFHFASLHSTITPMALFPQIFSPGATISVRIRPDNTPRTLAALKRDFELRTNGQPFEYRFVDDIFDALYRKEARTGKFFQVFALLSIFVACLGLFGLMAFTIDRKTKEIGIRKTLGASVPRIIALLTGRFARLILAANVVALPLAYFAMNVWLRNFAYKINSTLWTLFWAAGAVFVVALLTIGVQTAKAAMMNPADTLRYE